MKPLLQRVREGKVEHRLDPDDADRGYQMFLNKEDQCVKIVMKP